jgi:tetratricopeptide (TPR) repeat protein
MFNIGEAFRDDLNEPLKAAARFEEMNERFPSNSLLAESCVALYEIYKNSGNSQKAEYYRTVMLQNYPRHPKVLAATDPGFINRMKAKEAEEEADYNRILASYRSNRKSETYTAATTALNTYPSGRLTPQFTLLKVLSDNYNENIVAYRAALKNIVAEFKGNEAAVYAQSILNELEKTELSWATETINKEKPLKETASNYSTGDGTHSLIVITDPKVNFNKLNFNINSFNTDNFLEEDYETQITDFAENKMIVMSKIKDRKAAMEYYNKIIDDKNVFKDLSINDYVCFVILDSNLAMMKANKSFLDYMEFFNREYLK